MKTFLDSGVLLQAWRGEGVADVALQLLSDPVREFYTAQTVRLELQPKARYEKRQQEQAFYEAHFAEAVACERLSESLGREAEALAARYGLAGPDALQIAAAIRQGVKEFYTTEKPGRPMFRVKKLKVISLYTLPV